MTDVIPDDSNRLAYWLGAALHPAVICIPTLALVLRDLPVATAVGWTVVVAGIVVGPGIPVVAYLKRRERYVYQRHTRGILYVVAWLSVLVCLAVLLIFDAPRVLVVSTATLAVWVPLQMAINTYVTKISTHVAVASGCMTGLLLLGRLDTLLLQLSAIAVVVLVFWARVATRNHSVTQAALGMVVGVGTVLAVFPPLLGIF